MDKEVIHKISTRYPQGGDKKEGGYTLIHRLICGYFT
jgi:hypothetical protein